MFRPACLSLCRLPCLSPHFSHPRGILSKAIKGLPPSDTVARIDETYIGDDLGILRYAAYAGSQHYAARRSRFE